MPGGRAAGGSGTRRQRQDGTGRGRRVGLTHPPRGRTSSEQRSRAAGRGPRALTWPAAPASLRVRRGARAPLGERSGPAAQPARLLNESPTQPGSSAAPPPVSRLLAPPPTSELRLAAPNPAPLSRPRAQDSPARPRCSASPPLEPPRNCRARMLFQCVPWGAAGRGGCVCAPNQEIWACVMQRKGA